MNGATKAKAWPVPNVEAEIIDFAGSKFFASLDFCDAYCQLRLHPMSYDACGNIAPQGAFKATMVLRGLKNGAGHFQSHVP